MLFASLIPHAQIEDNSGEESALCDTEKEADDEESGEIVGEAHKGANDAPCKGEGRKPKSWSCEPEDDVGWDLEQDVADKVDGQRGEVLVSGLFQTVVRDTSTWTLGRRRTHVEIRDQTFNASVSD